MPRCLHCRVICCLTELPFHNISSSFLQVFLQCLATVNLKRVKQIGVKLLSECFAPESDHFKNETPGHSDAANESSNDFSKIPALFDNESCVRYEKFIRFEIQVSLKLSIRVALSITVN